MREIEAWRPDAVFVDAGRGEGVIDRCRQMGYQVTDVPFILLIMQRFPLMLQVALGITELYIFGISGNILIARNEPN